MKINTLTKSFIYDILLFGFENLISAPVAELADAPDLGSGVPDVKVQVLSGAPIWVFMRYFGYPNSRFLPQ